MAAKQPPQVHPKTPATGKGVVVRLPPQPSLGPSANPATPQTGKS